MAMITCPFCMESYDADSVHFRVDSPLDKRNIQIQINRLESELTVLQNTAASRADIENKQIRIDRMKATSLPFCINDEPDVLLRKYYTEMSIDISSVNDPSIYYPVVDFSNNKVLFGESSGTAKIRDKAGMLIGVKDFRGMVNQTRLCPCCHNALPENYGQNSTIFISLIGITQSGKTVYLSSFLRDLEDELAYAGLTLISANKNVNDFLNSYPVCQNMPLPMGTLARKPSEPLIFNVRTADGKNYTIVLFDIAGENCVDSQQMRIYGKFIKKSSGIVMLIDPSQFPELNGRLNNELDEEDMQCVMQTQETFVRTTPTKVLQTIHEAFFGAGNEKIQTPVALTVAKFDQLVNMVNDRNGLESVWNHVEIPGNIPVNHRFSFFSNIFKRDVANKHMCLRRFLSDDRSGFALLNHLDQLYARSVLFAASALGNGAHCSIKNSGGQLMTVLDTEPLPFGLYDPFFWILFNNINNTVEQSNPSVEKKDEKRGLFKFGRH